MIAWVLLAQMESHVSCRVQGSAKEALCAHELQNLRVLPKSRECTMHKLLLQFVLYSTRQLGRQHCLQGLISDHSWSKWFNSKSMKSHGQLAQWQANVIAPFGTNCGVAETLNFVIC